MKQITVYKAITGKIFEDEDLCSKHEDNYHAALKKYKDKLLKFSSTLDNSIGHCGPRERGDTSASDIFHNYIDRLAEFLAKSEMKL